MPISSVLTTLDGVEEALKPLYKEQDGEFHLELDDTISKHPSVVRLRNARDHEKAENASLRERIEELKAKLKALPDDFDPEKWEKAKDGKPDEAALVALRQEMEGQIADLTDKLQKSEEKQLTTAIERDLTDALTEAGVVNPSFAKAARTMLSPGVKIVEGAAVVETDMGPMPVAEHVKRWAAGEGKDFVAPPSGGGAKPGSGGSKGKSWDELTGTEKVNLRRSDPKEYDRLKAAANG